MRSGVPNRIRSSVRLMFVPYHIGQLRKVVPTFFRTDFCFSDFRANSKGAIQTQRHLLPPFTRADCSPHEGAQQLRNARKNTRSRSEQLQNGERRPASPVDPNPNTVTTAPLNSSASARDTSTYRSIGNTRSCAQDHPAMESSAPSRVECARA